MSSYFEPDNPNVALAAGVFVKGTNKVYITQPDLANEIIAVTAAGVWTYGAWATVVAAAVLTGHALIGYTARSAVVAPGQFQVGTGAAGAEFPIITAPFTVRSDVGVVIPNYLPLWPIIPAGQRVSVRWADSTGVADNGFFKLLFIPVPLT